MSISFNQYITRKNPESPEIKVGGPLAIWDWRNQTNVNAKVIEIPFFDKEAEIWEVEIEFENGIKHWAWYDEEYECWESGDQ